jgi:hypothetical protein
MGPNVEIFFSLCLFALKFDMVIVDACIDGIERVSRLKYDSHKEFDNQTSKLELNCEGDEVIHDHRICHHHYHCIVMRSIIIILKMGAPW